MEQGSNNTRQREAMFHTLREDFRRGDFFSSVRRDFHEAREFMIDEKGKNRLKEMSAPRQWLFTMGWLLKSVFFKLTPSRRLLLTAGIIMLVISRMEVYSGNQLRIQADTSLAGIVCVLFVLMLELKDKLIAKDELKEGHAVQQALMPTGSPQLPGWDIWLFTRSANDVGGDLVDFIRVNDDRFGVVLGDVAGKGLRAALLMAKLQASVRALASDVASPVELGQKLNAIFCRDSLRSIFASLVYAELRPHSGEVRLLNAGHMPPMVVHGDSVQSLPKGGSALGLMPSSEFKEYRVVLKPGDVLCVYSDGVTDAQGGAGNFFGESRLVEHLAGNGNLSAEEVGRKLVSEVDNFIGASPMFDDLSLALMRLV